MSTPDRFSSKVTGGQVFFLLLAAVSAAIVVYAIWRALTDPSDLFGHVLMAVSSSITAGLFIHFFVRSRAEGRRPS